jgi:hypothetical protein
MTTRRRWPRSASGSTASRWRSNWTHIIGGGNGALLFYDQANGQWATGRIEGDGSFDTVFVAEPATMSTNWTHLA